MKKKTSLTIEFDNAKTAKHFALWLCESGEQDYWEWMRYREDEEDGNITATRFEYHVEDKTKDKSDPNRYGKFMADNTIRTVCGRLDKNDK